MAMLIGAIGIVGGFTILFQESRVNQKVVDASSRSLHRFKFQATSRYERLRVKSYQLVDVRFGWIFYAFDTRQFLKFMQFLLDQVIIFLLVICET